MRMVLFLFCALAFIAPVNAAVEGTPSTLTDAQRESIRVNILHGLQDTSCDIRTGYILLVIEMRQNLPKEDLSYAVIPLMRLLKSDAVCGVRILAAQALFEFDSHLARFAVARRALYDDEPRVARRCAVLSKAWNQRPMPEQLATTGPR